MIEILKSDDKELNFIIKDINCTYANAIRRSSEEVPILAVDTIEFSKNDSVLYDEMLALRIGLIPLKSDKTFTLPEECTCNGKGCMKCTATLTLKITGPCMVKSGDLKSKTIKPVFPDIPLVLLQENQELELTAEARLGKGIEHAKYSPGLVWFRAYPHIEIGKDCNLCKECIKSCPKNVFESNGKILVKNILNCDLCNACVEACIAKGKNEIKIKGSDKDFIFEIESWGQITPKEIFIGSIKALKKNLKELDKDVNKL
ncbi:MAG: DNA-directed RNA polymerase subunit D [Candidatus Pacearchaeota archaeon]